MNPNVVRDTLILGGLEEQALCLSQNCETYRFTGSYRGNDFLLEFATGAKPYDSLMLKCQERDIELESALTVLMDYLPFIDYEQGDMFVVEWDRRPQRRFRALKKRMAGLEPRSYYKWVKKRNGKR